MRMLLGHLAQFASLATQGELLCTQGLAFVLQDAEARSALAQLIRARTGSYLPADVEWVAEAYQGCDRGRPDLEARKAGGVAAAKIEAKLGAELSAQELQSYARHLQASGGGPLVVLVPRQRTREAQATLDETLGAGEREREAASASAYPAVTGAVLTWEDLLAALRAVGSECLRCDTAQLESLFLALNGDLLHPVSEEDLAAWRAREGVFLTLVDRVTQRLTTGPRLMPLGLERLAEEAEEAEPKGYRRRYVCRPMGEVSPCFCIGVRDPLAGHGTPIWMRFHADTAGFRTIRARLEESVLCGRIVDRVDSDRGLWIPLHVPTDVDGREMIDGLVAQAEEVAGVAYGAET